MSDITFIWLMTGLGIACFIVVAILDILSKP